VLLTIHRAIPLLDYLYRGHSDCLGALLLACASELIVVAAYRMVPAGVCGDRSLCLAESRHDLLLAAVRIVFPEKRDSIILERNQSMVGDGDAVRIAC
jgi:hypothetical protein